MHFLFVQILFLLYMEKTSLMINQIINQNHWPGCATRNPGVSILHEIKFFNLIQCNSPVNFDVALGACRESGTSKGLCRD